MPIHIAPRFNVDGENVKIAVRGAGAPGAGAAGAGLDFDTVRSGLISVQCIPSSVVFITNCVPRYSVWGSCGENASGVICAERYFEPGTNTCDNCSVRLSKRTMALYHPSPYAMFESVGSTAMKPHSKAPGEYQSRKLISPKSLRLGTATLPLSCCVA